MKDPSHIRPITQKAAIARAARVLAAARRDRDELYVWGGAEALARAAYVPGGPAVANIAALYERLHAEAIRSTVPTTRTPLATPGGSAESSQAVEDLR